MTKKTVSAFILIGFFIAFAATCKNPLITKINDEVEVAVTPPEISQVYPASSAKNIPVNTNSISITFTKNVDSSSVSASSVSIADSNGTKLSGTFSVSAETITFTPSGNLSYSTTYTVTVTKGVKDKDGNSLAAAFSWSFSTGIAPDTVAPEISSVIVNSGEAWSNSLTVTVAITATDNYDTDETTSISHARINGGEWIAYQPELTYTITPGEGGRVINVAVKDGSGNVSESLGDSIAIDTVPPVVNNLIVNGGRPSTNERSLTISIAAIDEEGSGVTGYKFRQTISDGVTEPVWEETWSEYYEDPMFLDSKSLPDTAVNEDTFIFDCIVQDLAGNVSEKASVEILYDLSPPGLQNTSPLFDQTDVPYNTSIVVAIFDDSIDYGSLNANSFKIMNGTTQISGILELYSNNDIPNSKLLITELDLDQNTDYIAILSSDIQDIAGNLYGVTTSWYFRTGDALDTTAPTGTVVPTVAGPFVAKKLPNGTYAVNDTAITLDITAYDDYNSVYGMKFWGEGSLPQFETGASWEAGGETAIKSWTLDAIEREYVTLYKLMDSAGNESENAIQLKVRLDQSVPVFEGATPLTLSTGSVYSSNADGFINIIIDASDDSGIDGIMFINGTGNVAPAIDDPNWENWSPIREEWQIDTGKTVETDPPVEGEKNIEVYLKDYIGYISSVATLTINWDLTPPDIIFIDEDHTYANTGTLITGSINDPDPPGDIASGIKSYLWEQESGPGTLTISNPTAEFPTVSANIEGTYILRLTATDNAGNSSNAPVPYTWDITGPAAMSTIDTGSYYINNNQPTISWDPVDGADKYLVSIDGGAIDEVESVSYTPGSALSEGSHTFSVTPSDWAGNTSGAETANVIIDTIAPEITQLISGAFLFPLGTITLNFNGTHGEVIEANPIDTIQWSMVSGPETANLSFSAQNALTTNLTPTMDGYYQVKLEVTDTAGNTGEGTYTVIYDTIAPNAPNVNGIDHTPDRTPTWSWSSGGNGGSGYFSYRLIGNSSANPYVNWTAPATVTSFTPGTDLDDDPDGGDESSYTYTLEVREYDEAGNESASNSHSIWVDFSYTAPPQVVPAGSSVQSSPSITWNWNSGADQVGATYRYMVLDESQSIPTTPPFDGLSWDNTSGAAGDVIETATESVSTNMGEDEEWTIIVEEYHSTNSVWIGKLGYYTVRVDRQGPAAPNVSNATSSPTKDTTPTWNWTRNASSDGTGQFQYSFNELSWTEISTTTLTASPLLEGSYTLYVQEKDSLGNWGTSGTSGIPIVVDTTAPTLNSVTIVEGDYTDDRNITASVSAVYESGLQYSYFDYLTSDWTSWVTVTTGNFNIPITTTAGEGPKHAVVKLKDQAGNECSYLYDTTTLDQTAPTNVTVTINNGEAYTPSRDCYVDVSATDGWASLSDCDIQFYYYKESIGDWGYSSWYNYSDRILLDTNFTASAGDKTVYAQVRDPAGNVSTLVSDTIYLQIPSVTYANKGNSPSLCNVYYSPVTEDPGSNTTRYYLYWTTNSGINPNVDDSGLTYSRYTTNTSSTYGYSTYEGLSSSYFPAGEIIYFYIRAYNADTGGYGPYSLSAVRGFASHITIIYDDDDSADVTRAQKIKATLEDTIYSGRSIVDGTTIGGTMPTWTATMYPEDYVSNSTYGTAEIVSGDPIILSHGFTGVSLGKGGFPIYYTNRVRNLVSSGKGFVAMGDAVIALDLINTNWSSWGLSGTQPTHLGLSNNNDPLSATRQANRRPASTSESIWWTPIRNEYIWNDGAGAESTNSCYIFTSNVNRWAIDFSSKPPSSVYLYAGNGDGSTYYPVARMDRFLHYGFSEPARTQSTQVTTYEYGIPFFINLIARMDNF